MDPHRIVVICYPRVRYSESEKNKMRLYCHHQLIRYSSWDLNNLNELRNLNTAIERWKEFLKTADPDLLLQIEWEIKFFDCIKILIVAKLISFTKDLSMQLLDAGKQAPIDITEDLLVQDPWMVLS